MTSENIFYTVEVVEKTAYYSLAELCHISNLDEVWVKELLDYGIISPSNEREQYDKNQLDTLMKAYRLQNDLELNVAGIALALQLLEQIEQQESELNMLRFQATQAE